MKDGGPLRSPIVDESTKPALVPVMLPEPATPELLPALDLAQPLMTASSLGTTSAVADTLATSVFGAPCSK